MASEHRSGNHIGSDALSIWIPQVKSGRCFEYLGVLDPGVDCLSEVIIFKHWQLNGNMQTKSMENFTLKYFDISEEFLKVWVGQTKHSENVSKTMWENWIGTQ